MNISASRLISILLLAEALSAVSTVAGAHPLDNWYGRYTNSSIASLNGITFGNGLFVAVGTGGTILTSTNGESWSSQSSGTSLRLARVSYGNGTFVIAGSSGCLLSSTNGTNWTLRTCPGISLEYNGLAFGNNTFVAASANLAGVSSNGVNWTAYNTGASFPQSVVFGNGLFLTEITSQTNTGSNTGTNWFPLPSGSPTTLYTIGFGAGKFLSIDTQNHVFSSPNGSNWTQIGSVPLLRPTQIAYGSGHFVTVGGGPIYYSQQGDVWKQSTTGYLYVALSVAYGQGTFVAVGGGARIIQSDPVVWLGPAAANAFNLTGPEGRNVSIEVTDNISSNSWHSVSNFVLTQSPTLWTDPEPPVSSQKFYRAVLP
jgi:hypothetical protein